MRAIHELNVGRWIIARPLAEDGGQWHSFDKPL